jgi:hypothetical protein
MTVTITITEDRRVWDAVAPRLASLGGVAARVGLHEPEQAVKGQRHEFGFGVPARPWMGPATDNARETAGDKSRHEIGDVVDGKTSIESAMEGVGEVIAKAQRDIILDGQVGGPPLSEQAKRRDPRKLYDTGAMVGSIETRVGEDKAGE